MHTSLVWGIALLFFLILGLARSPVLPTDPPEILASDSTRTAATASPPDLRRTNETLPPGIPIERVILPVISGSDATYGIVVTDLSSGQVYRHNSDYSFEAASLYKLWVMAAVYRRIEQGNLSEEDVLSESISVLNRKFSIRPEDAELTSGTITLSVRDALTRMITLSDNYSALLLTAHIRLSAVADFLKEHGFSESKVGTTGGPPMTTAADMDLFFSKLTAGDLGVEAHTQKMLTLLKNQQINRKLPMHLPPDTVIAHKTGELGAFSHDAGIVYTPGGGYRIAVLTQSANPVETERKIAQLSRNIYDYFTQQ